MEIHVCVAWRKSERKVLLLTRSSHSYSNGNIITRWAAVHKRVSFVVVVAMAEGVMSWNVCTAHHEPHNPRLCLITQAKNARFSHRLRSVILVVHPRLMFIIASGPAQCTTNQHIYQATEFIMCVVSHPIPPTHSCTSCEEKKSHTAGQVSTAFGQLYACIIFPHKQRPRHGKSATFRCSSERWSTPAAESEHTRRTRPLRTRTWSGWFYNFADAFHKFQTTKFFILESYSFLKISQEKKFFAAQFSSSPSADTSNSVLPTICTNRAGIDSIKLLYLRPASSLTATMRCWMIFR